MKLIHISDLHIGKIVNGFNMLEDQKFALQEILELSERHEIDALLIAGDIYDKSTPTAEAVSVFDWFLSQLSQAEIPVFAVPGNHDSAERIAFAQEILQKQGIHLPPVFNGTITHFTLHDECGPITIWLLPFLKPVHVRQHFPNEEIGSDYTAAIKCVLESCPINKSERNILAAHQFVTATNQETHREDSELNLGGIDNVDASVFRDFDYVALGHVHRPQKIGRETIRYSGSLLKYSFSEARYPKSAVLVELGKKDESQPIGSCVSWTQLEYPQLHDMRIIKGPLKDLTQDDLQTKNDSHDYILAILTDSTPQIDAMARVRSAYPNVMQLEYDKGSPRDYLTQRNPEIDSSDIDPISLFERFFEEQTQGKLTNNQKSIYSDILTGILESSARNKDGN